MPLELKSNRKIKYLKNNVFIGLASGISAICMLFLGFFLLITLPNGGWDKDLILFVSLFVGFILVPPWLICFICFKQAFTRITFSENGIQQTFFGKQVSFIEWEKASVERYKSIIRNNIMPIFEFFSNECKISILLSKRKIHKILTICTNEKIKTKLKNSIKNNLYN
ncbi:MAG: hypothetical protein FWH03_06545 [Firmicutes bacterium]|nr:hypothetical protein [Bacillota bacterium]